MDVLIVDDDDIMRRAIAHLLTTADYTIAMARDGREALEMLRRGPFQLVISDWNMPRMNGVELCRAIRDAGFPRYVYFIMLTGHTNADDTIAGLNAGADDYVTKPFNPLELILRVNIGRRILSLETCDMTIFALAKLAESRDPETGGHLERVRSYCRALARRLQQGPPLRCEIDDEYLRLIYQTSPLHDIGKVAIPDFILLKPDRLTDHEFELMKMHTVYGAETLDAARKQFPQARFLQMARDIAISHHERYDGSGYPYGLSGDDIPLCGRIVAVADVYDALTSKRIYKEAFTHDVAKATILESVNTHFDPRVVDAFLAEEQQFIQIRREHAESSGVSPDVAAVEDVNVG